MPQPPCERPEHENSSVCYSVPKTPLFLVVRPGAPLQLLVESLLLVAMPEPLVASCS